MTKKTKNDTEDEPSRQKATNWKGEASGERMKTPTETKEPQNTVSSITMRAGPFRSVPEWARAAVDMERFPPVE